MFVKKLKRVINTGQARVIILTGNIHDLFFDGNKYVPLLEYLSSECQAKPTSNSRGITQLIYRLNNPINCRGDQEELDVVWKRISGTNTTFGKRIAESNRNTTFALELMRQLTEGNRRYHDSKNNLLIMLEAADMIIPENEINRMSISDRHRVGILHDWFCDPKFMDGGDTVILLAESRSQVHHRIARLPHVISIEVPLPDMAARRDYVNDYTSDTKTKLSVESIAEQSSGLSIHALRQFLRSGDHDTDALAAKVEEYMVSQVGEGVIEFKRPSHTLKDVIGFKRVKDFMINELIPGFLNGSIGGAAVGGPIGCHRKGQGILMWDGSIRSVERIFSGDFVMGMDSQPRIVTNHCRGKDDMYKIIPKKGDPFFVNEHHILTLARTPHKKDEDYELVDVMLKDYLGWSKWMKSIHKLVRVGVDFPDSGELEIEPYFMGVLLGDGSFRTGSPSVTNQDQEIIQEVYRQATCFNLKVRKDEYGDRCPSYYIVGKKKIPNPLTLVLRSFGLWGLDSHKKFIPHKYKTASLEDRMELVAGLIDTDGSLGNNVFDYSSVSERLAKDFMFVCRSLDFAAYVNYDDSLGRWRVSVSGHISIINCRVSYKNARGRLQKKLVNRTGFDVKYIGEERYYGFRVDQDNRYLLDDFTVTHNSGKTFICEAVAAELGIPVITLKNIRSKWYGETDAIFERLQRLLKTFHRIVIFVDEADTQFGSISDGHATERRLTGKIQAMMSDVQLRGKVIWFLMTARIHLLSPDIRRPGRMDLIIPILDPEGEDRNDFLRWCFDSIESDSPIEEMSSINNITKGYSSAAFAMLRGRIKAKGCDLEEALDMATDMVLPDIEEARLYQTLQAKLNCTRLSLLSDDADRKGFEESRTAWKQEITRLESEGIR